MKDIVISPRSLFRELRIFLGCLLAALAVNVYAILRFHTHWKELFTTFHITLAIAAIFFALLALPRAAFFFVRRRRAQPPN